MRSLFLLIAMVLALPAHGQVRDVVSGLYAPTLDNYIKNSDCFANTRDISVTGSGTITRTTSTPLRGVASCSIDSNVSGDDIIFATRTFDRNMFGKDCEASFDYTGDATAYNFYPVQNSVAIAPTQTLLNAGTNSLQARVFFPCGDGTNATTLVLEANTGGAPAVKIGNVKIGVMRDASLAQAQIAGTSYFVAGTSTQTRTSSTPGAFTGVAGIPGPTVEFARVGTWLTTDANLFKQTVQNLPPGDYVAEFQFVAYNSASTNAQVTIFDGTTTCKNAGGQTPASNPSSFTLRCPFSYSQGATRDFELYGSSSTSTLTISGESGTGITRDVRFTLYYFPPASRTVSTQCNNNPAQCENEFSLKSSNAGVVSAESLDFLNGNFTVSPTGTFTGTFNTGIFTVAPNCTANSSGSSYAIADIDTTSTTVTVKLVGRNDTLTPTNQAFTLQCQKQGADYGSNKVIVGTFSEIPRAPGISKPRVIRYAFGGTSATLASPTNCGASPCVEVYDSASVVSPPTRSGTGQYASVTIANGTFKASSPIHCSCQAFETANTARDCAVEIGTDSWSTNASGGYVANINTTTPSGTNRDAYVMLTCEGEAP